MRRSDLRGVALLHGGAGAALGATLARATLAGAALARALQERDNQVLNMNGIRI